ncbi:MAG TPA: hypothetical protein VJ746_01975 [Nitrospira sp.]|nr:hypothetical protein [Nitrospira sp.]
MPGWINVDRQAGPGIDLACDIRHGIPLAGRTIRYIVAMHVLQDLSFGDLHSALVELRRTLQSGGVLRLGLPDLDKAIDAYVRRDHRYFYVPDRDAQDIGTKLITQITWYGSVRTPMTYGFVYELLTRAGFREIRRCSFKQTFSRDEEIVLLDNRERESFFVEAVR